MGVRSRSRKAYGVIALVAILALSFSATAAFGAVDFEDADFSGYATGTVLHANALEMGGTRVLGVGEAVTGSQVNSNGLTEIKDEMDRVVTSSPAGKKSAGKGIALEACIAQGNSEQCTLELGDPAHTAAPPSTPVVTNDLVNVPGDPLIFASVLRGQSQSLWSNDQCILGRDIAFGRAHAADVQLINSGGTLPDNSFLEPLVATDFGQAGVASSYSHEFMDVARNSAGNPISTVWGLSSEVSMELVPITLFKGTENEVTIQLAGTWKLRASTGGIPGSANIEYGPDETPDDIPLLKIKQPGVPDTNILFLDQILDALGQGDGIEIPASPLVTVHIGEQPRAIGGAFGSAPTQAANGTVASAAVDVVRIVVGDVAEGTHLAEIRVGHMEVKAQTPEDGINCGIPVTKTANPPGVSDGQTFVVTIKIDNPFGCDLTAVKVVDDITTTGGAKFDVVDTNPQANTVPPGTNLDSGTIIWNNIGSIPKGESKSVTTTIRGHTSGDPPEGGEIIDIADVSAVLGNCEGQGNGNAIVGTSLPLRVPVVLKLALPPTGVGTSTGTILAALMLLSLAGVAIRQIKRHA